MKTLGQVNLDNPITLRKNDGGSTTLGAWTPYFQITRPVTTTDSHICKSPCFRKNQYSAYILRGMRIKTVLRDYDTRTKSRE